MEDNGSGLFPIREGRYIYEKRKAGMSPALLLEFKVWKGELTVLNIYLERQKIYRNANVYVYVYICRHICMMCMCVLYVYTWINFLVLSTETAWEQHRLS